MEKGTIIQKDMQYIKHIEFSAWCFVAICGGE